METRLAVRQVKLQEWSTIIKARRDSGLNIAEFCEQNNLSRNAYFYWLKKLRGETLKSAGPKFAEITQPSVPSSISQEPVSAFDAQLTFTINNVVISVNSSTPRDLLAMAMEVAENA